MKTGSCAFSYRILALSSEVSTISCSQIQMLDWTDLKIIQSMVMSPVFPYSKLTMITVKTDNAKKKSCHSTLSLKIMFKNQR